MMRAADWRLIEPVVPSRHKAVEGASSACFVVRLARSGWAVEREGAAYGRFTDLQDAIDHGCRLARHQAACGLVGVVLVEAAPSETHIFTPSPARTERETAFSE